MRYHRVNGEIVRFPEEGEGSLRSPSSSSEEHEDEFLLQTLQSHPPSTVDPRKRSLPFQPLSYRDFMLFEQHYIDVAQGMTSLFLPLGYRLGCLYHSISSYLPLPKTFPAFLPPKIWYDQAIFYQSNHLGFVADGSAIVLPGSSSSAATKGGEEVWLDFELELGILLGKDIGPNASVEESWDAIAGFCVLNDFSRRETQMGEMRSGFGPQGCKGFGNAISGTVTGKKGLVVEDGKEGKITGMRELRGRVKVNGKVVRECVAGAKDWQWSVGEAIAHASRDTRLYAGEFFGSGTIPGGAGIEKGGGKEQVRLKVGDEVKLEIDGVGSVTNRIVGESGDEE